MSKFIKTALFGAMAGVMAFSAMAEEVKPEVNDTEIITETAAEDSVVSEVKKSNPKIAFPHGVQLGIGMSASTGINGFVGYNNKNFDSFWWKRLGFRADFATMSPLKSKIKSSAKSFIGEDGVELDEDAGLYISNFALDSHHAAALIDIYPFGDTWFLGGWRLTGGYVFGKTKLTADLTGKLDGAPEDELSFEFNDVKYRYLGNVVKGKAKLNWNFAGPYAGTGLDLGLFAGFKIYLDAGVVFTSKAAELDFDINPNNLQVLNNPSLDPSDDANWSSVSGPLVDQFNENKDAELKDINDEFNKYKFYPMVKLGFMYRF